MKFPECIFHENYAYAILSTLEGCPQICCSFHLFRDMRGPNGTNDQKSYDRMK